MSFKVIFEQCQCLRRSDMRRKIIPRPRSTCMEGSVSVVHTVGGPWDDKINGVRRAERDPPLLRGRCSEEFMQILGRPMSVSFVDHESYLVRYSFCDGEPVEIIQ